MISPQLILSYQSVLAKDTRNKFIVISQTLLVKEEPKNKWSLNSNARAAENTQTIHWNLEDPVAKF